MLARPLALRALMPKTLFVRHGRLHYFVREVLKRMRLPAPHASKVGDALVAADLAGVEGEGARRLPFFASRIGAGLINPSADIRVAFQERATAVIDGGNGMGHVVAARAMELAIEKAKELGVAAVAARNSNDFGMAGYYARLALAEQMIGIVMSNGAPAMVPTYGTRAELGSNPLAIAIPHPRTMRPSSSTWRPPPPRERSSRTRCAGRPAFPWASRSIRRASPPGARRRRSKR